MKQINRISDSIESLSEGQIRRKKRKVIIPACCIIIGIILVWWGIEKWSLLGYVLTSYFWVFGGLFLIGWAIVMLSFNTTSYIVEETHESIRPKRINLDPDQRNLIEQLMKQGDLENVLKYQIKRNSPLMLELWSTGGHQLLYSQLLYYHDSKTRPISDPVVSKKK